MAGMFYTLIEVAEKLGKSEKQIRDMIQDGKLREFRDGPKLLFKKDEVDALAGQSSIPDDTLGLDQGTEGSTLGLASDDEMSEMEGLDNQDFDDENFDLELDGSSMDMALSGSDLDIELDGDTDLQEKSEPQEPQSDSDQDQPLELASDQPDQDQPLELEPVEEEPQLPPADEPQLAPESQSQDDDFELALEPDDQTQTPETKESDQQDIDLELEPQPQADAEEPQVDSEEPQQQKQPDQEIPALADDTGDLQLDDMQLDSGSESGGDFDFDLDDNEGTKSTNEGISVLGESDSEYKLTDDSLSETAEVQLEGEGDEPSLDEDVNLESFGSGSGLLDLSLQADDTSLGAVLDDIIPGAGGGADEPAMDAGGDDIFAAASTEDIEEQPSAGINDFQDISSAPAESAPQATAGAVVYAEPAPDSSSNIFGSMLILPMIISIFTIIVAMAGSKGITPSLLTQTQSIIWYVAAGLAVIALVWMFVGIAAGGTKSPKPAKAKKDKKLKAAKPKKEKKKKK